jgi:hypothetical protein
MSIIDEFVKTRIHQVFGDGCIFLEAVLKLLYTLLKLKNN